MSQVGDVTCHSDGVEAGREEAVRGRARKGAAIVVACSLMACTGQLVEPPGGNGEPEGGEVADHDASFEPQPGLLRRLTRAQFRNATYDLTGVTVDVQELEADSFKGEFASVGASTVVTSNLGAEQYLAAIEGAVAEVFSDEDQAEAFLGCAPAMGDDSCFHDFLGRVGTRAWRRPLIDQEVEQLTGVARTAEAEFASAMEGARWGTVALLASPNFLYRTELGASDGDSLRLLGYEMASRLSFLLWNTLPDTQLLEDAEAGALSTTEGVLAAATRMLEDPRGREAVAAFAEEYMRLDRIAGQAKDPVHFPEYGPGLKEAMVVDMRETWANVALQQDRSVLDLFSTTAAVANADLARLYGLDDAGMDSQSFAEVSLPDAGPRLGILGKAGFLSQFANQVEGSPTLRGKFIREALLCTTIPAPPGDVALELPEPSPDRPTTKRERLGRHNSDKACANCHTMMDPLGLPLEQFDAIGRFRTTELGLTIDASGEFDGVPVADAKELGVVMSESVAISECMVRKYFSYALGRPEVRTDDGVLNALSTSFEESGYRFRELILALIASEAFSVVQPRQGDLP